MRIWNLNPVTGEYLGQSIADESPLEPGVYLIPAHATAVPPPDVGEHQAAVFRDGTASVVADWRGHRYWLADGSEHVVTELGAVPAADWLTEKPAKAPVVVTATQGEIALLRAGLLDDVEAFVAAAENREVRSAFRRATEWHRDSPMLRFIWDGLGRSEAELDALFAVAAAIEI